MRSFREKFNIASELADAIQPLADAPESVLTQECRLQAAALAEKCRRHLFYFVFLGQFKRGKTTLINSLLGRPLLPSGVLPLTAVVTFVRRGERTAACVRRLNGELEEIRIEDIPLYVTETANPNNRKQVAAVEVWTETVPFAENICLVDTPGIGSLYEHNTRVAYEFVQRADAAVFVVSPESPLTVAELEFLEHVRRHVEKIFFVLNKADQIDAAEREQLLAFIRQAAKLPAEAKLFALSAQRALQLGGQDSDFLVFRRALEEFFENHSAQLFVRSSVAALRRIVAQERLRLELEYQALRLDQDELNARIARIEEQWKRLEVRRTEVSYILRGELAALEQSVWDRLQRWVEDERYECTREVLEKARSVPAGSRQQCVMLIERRLDGKFAGAVTAVAAARGRALPAGMYLATGSLQPGSSRVPGRRAGRGSRTVRFFRAGRGSSRKLRAWRGDFPGGRPPGELGFGTLGDAVAGALVYARAGGSACRGRSDGAAPGCGAPARGLWRAARPLAARVLAGVRAADP